MSDNTIGIKKLSVAAIERRARKYFTETPEPKITIAGLLQALDISLSTYRRWCGEYNSPHGEALKKAILPLMAKYEGLASKPGMGHGGPVFLLKQLGMRDEGDKRPESESPLSISQKIGQQDRALLEGIAAAYLGAKYAVGETVGLEALNAGQIVGTLRGEAVDVAFKEVGPDQPSKKAGKKARAALPKPAARQTGKGK